MKALYSLLVAALVAAGIGTASAAEPIFVDTQAVRQAQKILNDRGFRTGGVDGRMGPQTQAALVSFQRSEKLEPSGKLDRPTLHALGMGEPQTRAADGVFVNSHTVRQAQKILNDRGFRTGGVDGHMGPQTKAALVSFQKVEKLQPSGKLDRPTLSALGLETGERTASANAASRYPPATIRKLQETLNARGYKAGPASGNLDDATREALREFQRSEKIAVTGRPNPRTLARLGIGDTGSAGSTARR